MKNVLRRSYGRLTLASMGSEKLHDLMRRGPKCRLQISENTVWIEKIQTALERALQDAPNTVPLNLFFLPVTSQEGQTTSRIFSNDAFPAKIDET